jgi:hypothetical protein
MQGFRVLFQRLEEFEEEFPSVEGPRWEDGKDCRYRPGTYAIWEEADMRLSTLKIPELVPFFF